MKRSAWLASLCVLGVAACATDGDGERAGAVSTELRAADGRPMGLASVTQEAGGVRVRITSTALPPGTHGAHLHSTGQCAAPDFTSAGPHWNPGARKHGHNNPAGYHQGDLGSVGIGADGRLIVGLLVPGTSLHQARLSAPLVLGDADGAALVIHADPDDERTDPSGNSGARIACAVIAG